jgi:predicted type IV restriction endonuclease
MDPEHKRKLQRLAEMSVDDIGNNENNVKYKFIIPFLESFGYKTDFDFEHSAQGNRIDILIDKVSDYTILIEAKSYGKNMDDYISQLKRYCDEKRPILAIISNGEEIWFYSPFWKKANFAETRIFSIARNQLSDDGTIEKIERVLGKQFLKKDEEGRIRIVKHIEEREKEIDNIKKEIQSLDSEYQGKIETLNTSIHSLEEQLKSIELHIDNKNAERVGLKAEKEQKIQDLKKKTFFTLLNQGKKLQQ